MCSYNGLNGTYACADPVSLGKWLHEELNFQGWVLSDFGSVYEDTEIASANSGLDSVIGSTTRAYGREEEGRLPSKSLNTLPNNPDAKIHSEPTAPCLGPLKMAACLKVV